MLNDEVWRNRDLKEIVKRFVFGREGIFASGRKFSSVR